MKDMPQQELLKILEMGVDVWNSWRLKNPDISIGFDGAFLGNLPDADFDDAFLFNICFDGVDLSGISLYHATITGSTFLPEVDFNENTPKTADRGEDVEDILVDETPTCLEYADLRHSTFFQCDLCSANLYNADLSDAHITETRFAYANLSKALLKNADFREINLSTANLIGADLTGAILSGADLSNADLTGAILSGADLSGVNLSGAILTGAILSGADLSGVNLSGAILTGADLTGCFIHGVSVWDTCLDNTIQSNLIISKKDEPVLKVDNLELAQFIYLLLNHKKLRDVLNLVTERGVLLLGRFSNGGLDLLQAIAARLREMHYLPMIFDFDRPDHRNYTETVKTLVGLSRFVIVDLSGPSVPQELYASVPHYDIPFVPIIENGRKPYVMFADLLMKPHVIKPIVEFESQEQLLELLPSRVIEPAEAKFKERQALLDQIFHK